MRLLTIAFLVPLLWAQQPRGNRDRSKSDEVVNPFARDPAAAEQGRKLYLGACSGCHGPTGEGGRGPKLARGGQVRGASDEQLRNTIRNGIPGADMPPFPLDDDKIWQLVTFVRSLSAPAFESNTAGDPEHGRALFFGRAGCSQCHMIRGRGGFLGPDLSNAGMANSSGQLREALLDPSARIASGYRGAAAITLDGGRIEGVARDNTNYTLQILDTQGGLHLLPKAELREVEFRKSSLMPGDYKQRLKKDEVEDLLAFLSRQAGREPAEKEK